MEYHRGLLRQRGHGIFGTLLKIGGPLVGGALAPLLGDVAGGLLKKVIPGQKGKGFVTDALRTAAKHGIHVTSRAAIDRLDRKGTFVQGLRKYGTQAVKDIGVNAVEQKLRQNLPILRAPIVGSILNKTMMPLVRRKVGSAIDNAVNQVLGQRGKGMVSDLVKVGVRQLPALMKTGARALLRTGVRQGPRILRKGARELALAGSRQALKSAAQAGMDVVTGKKSLKNAVQTRGRQALRRTHTQMKRKYAPPPKILARGGPPPRKRPRQRTKAPKARTTDIFD